MITALIVAFTVGVVAFVYFEGKRGGKKASEAEVMEDVLDDVHTAKLARDRLAGDTAVRKRVRKKYTRK